MVPSLVGAKFCRVRRVSLRPVFFVHYAVTWPSSRNFARRQPQGNGHDIPLIRYNPDGTLDPTFGSGGVVVSLLSDNVFAATLQPGGRILVAGTRLDMEMEGMNGPLQLVRFLPDVSLGQGWLFEGDGTTKVFACVPR